MYFTIYLIIGLLLLLGFEHFTPSYFVDDPLGSRVGFVFLYPFVLSAILVISAFEWAESRGLVKTLSYVVIGIFIVLTFLIDNTVNAQDISTETKVKTTTETTTKTAINIDSIVDAKVKKALKNIPQAQPPSEESFNGYNRNGSIRGNSDFSNSYNPGVDVSTNNDGDRRSTLNSEYYKSLVSKEEEFLRPYNGNIPLYQSHPRLQEIINRAYIQGLENDDLYIYSGDKKHLQPWMIKRIYEAHKQGLTDNQTHDGESESIGFFGFLLRALTIIGGFFVLLIIFE